MPSIIHNLLISPAKGTLMQLVRYTFVGALAFAIDYGTLYCMSVFLELHYLVGVACGFVLGLMANYALSRLWVFGEGKMKDKRMEFALFAMIGVAGLGLTELLMWVFTDQMNIYFMYSKIAVVAIVYLWNFFARKYLLFNK